MNDLYFTLQTIIRRRGGDSLLSITNVGLNVIIDSSFGSYPILPDLAGNTFYYFPKAAVQGVENPASGSGYLYLEAGPESLGSCQINLSGITKGQSLRLTCVDTNILSFDVLSLAGGVWNIIGLCYAVTYSG